MTPVMQRTLVLGALSLALFLPDLAFAQGLGGGGGGPLTSEATTVATWVVTIAKIIAVVFIVAGFAMLASGRWAMAGLAGMVFGVIGMAKADQIAQWLMT